MNSKKRECYQFLLKPNSGILQFLRFDWLTGNGIWAHSLENITTLSWSRKKSEWAVFFTIKNFYNTQVIFDFVRNLNLIDNF